MSPQLSFTLRCAMLHMIEQAVRHGRHLDLLRERSDGQVAQ
jgi:hypothetical protein